MNKLPLNYTNEKRIYMGCFIYTNKKRLENSVNSILSLKII